MKMDNKIMDVHKLGANEMEGSRETEECMNQCRSYAHRRRRRQLSGAVVTVAALAASSFCSAFSHSALPCHSGVQSSSCLVLELSPNDNDNTPRRGSRSLNMVSFLESEMITRQKVKARSRSRARGPNGTGRQIDLRFEPTDGELDFNFFVTETTTATTATSLDKARQSSSQRRASPRSLAAASLKSSSVDDHAAPEIDSVVLYSSITKAPPATQDEVNVAANVEEQPGLTNNSTDPTPKSTATTLDTITPTFKSKSKSSTMPGFITPKGLDEYVTSRTTTRMTTSTKRNVSRRMSRAAKAKRRQLNSEALYKKSSSVPDSLLDYAQEIHSISRVTPSQEIELGTKTQEAIRLQKMYTDLRRKYGREPTDDEWCAAAGKINMEALKEALQAGNEAKNQLVASNLRMVQRVVNLYIRNGLGSEYNAGDLMQDGTMALIRAAEKYEPDRGFRFSTYAMYWIRSAVKRSQTMQSRIVNVPQRIHETYKRVSKMEAQLRVELGRDPTKSELADVCEITVVQLDRCRRAMQQASFSLDAELYNSKKPGSNGSHNKKTMLDVISTKMDETEYERTQRLLMREHLITTLRRYLTPHEVELLLLRYGLMDSRALPKGMSGPLTIAEVSKLVGLKPDKVRRIIINSQKQLRHLMKEWEDFECEAT
ncbi:hypothetical protein ACHAXN_007651 [Cyclotella atomus]